MRRSWIAIAMIAVIAVLVGLAAGYKTAQRALPAGDVVRADRGPKAAPLIRENPKASEFEGSRPTDREAPATRDDAAPRGGSVRPARATTPAGPSDSARPSVPATPAPMPAAIATTTPQSISQAPPQPSRPPPAAGASSPEPGSEAAAPAEGSPDDPESDRRPPVLQMIRFDPPEIKDGGTAMLSVSSTDDLSGVKFVYGSIRSPSGAAILPFSARDATGSGVFTVSIAIPTHGETGEWFVGNLQIVDKAGNTLAQAFVRGNVPPGGALRVVSQESDSTPPTVHRVWVVQGSVAAGERNQVVVEVDDEQSGVGVVTGAFQSPSKSAYIAFHCVQDGDSPTWTGAVIVPANADCGEWTLRQLRVVDKANNTAFLSMDQPEVGRLSFVVSGGGECDSEPPTIDAIQFSPPIVSNADATLVTLTIAAHDDRSGLGGASGWIDGPVAANGQAPRINFECIPDPAYPDGPMTARVTVPPFAAKGVWRVTLAQISDKARNTRAYNRDDPALREARFEVE